MNSSQKYGTKLIASSKLEKFANRTLHRNYTVSFTCPEFTCHCPRSGFPDFATLYIDYQPDKYCVELKSLKLYINGYREQAVFHEDVANKILDDLTNLLKPKYMRVLANFNVRGNIHTTIEAIYGAKS